jgi:hypothetical protein
MSVRVVSAAFRVVTPLFLGGAEPTKYCELRPASIKGALVFWWRALRPDLPLAELRGEEEALFGSSEGGQSKWLLDARSEVLGLVRKLELDDGRGYLAGQGLAGLRKDTQQQPQRRFAGASATKPFESTRPYFRPGGKIFVRAFRREVRPEGPRKRRRFGTLSSPSGPSAAWAPAHAEVSVLSISRR